VADIHVQRTHRLGLPRARELAARWVGMAQEKLAMQCSYEQGESSDLVSFARAGCTGELKVTQDSFELDARLGFLLGAFKDRIEAEIEKNLDHLLAQEDPLLAFDQAVAPRAAAKRAGGKA
jgi:putative polyhydroxyalkanoate system protein